MTRANVLFNRRFAIAGLAAALLAGFVLAAILSVQGSVSASEHSTGFEEIDVTPTEVDLEPGNRNSATVVWIRGSGFVPGVEILLLVEDSNGVTTDITGLTSVSPLVANDQGAWATRWTLGRWTRTGIGGEGMQSLWAVDRSYNNLASAPIALCDLAGRAKALVETPDAEIQVPDWCSA